MSENRYENRLNKDNIKFNTLNPVWDNETETALNVFEMINRLNEQEVIINELTQKKNDLKELLVNSKPITDQKTLQNLIYKMVRDMIDDKIKELSNKDIVCLIPRESITVLTELKEELMIEW